MHTRAVFVARHGGPDALELRDFDPGPPGPAQLRVRVRAAGVNFIDTYLRSGAYPRTPPFVLGFEGAGVVEDVGEGVQGVAIGARVAWAQVPGSYADVLLAPASAVVPIPDELDDDSAAAAMLQGMTAHYLSHGTRDTQPGDLALVHAAAGGTGRLLVQLLHRAGARVIGTCGSAEKATLAREAGAEQVVRYDETDFVAEVKRLTDGRGVDVVYDSVGRTTFDGSLACLRPRGLCVLFGQASGAVAAFDPQRLNQAGSVFLTRPSLAHYIASPTELCERASAVLTAVAQGALSLRIERRLPLDAAAEAHRLLEGRKTAGKLLLLPNR